MAEPMTPTGREFAQSLTTDSQPGKVRRRPIVEWIAQIEREARAEADLWGEANAVMPGGWRVREVTDLMIGPPNDFVATAVSIGRLRAGVRNAYGDSPASALDNLTRKLRAMRDGHGE